MLEHIQIWWCVLLIKNTFKDFYQCMVRPGL